MSMLDLQQYAQDLTSLRKTLVEAGDALHIENLKETLEELTEEMNQPEFWNDADHANKINQKVGTIRAKIEHYEGLLSLADDIEVAMEMAEDEQDEAIIDLCCDHENAVCLLNKSDLGNAVEPSDLPFMTIIQVCAKTGEGLDQLSDMVEAMFEGSAPCDGSILTNTRQFDACRRAYEAMLRSLKGLQLGLTPDAVLTDVEEAMEAMGEVTGATVREDITNRIFERFCVGK